MFSNEGQSTKVKTIRWIAAIVVAVVGVVAWMQFTEDRGWAAPSAQVEQERAMVPPRCGQGGDPCPPAKRMVQNFKQGKYGNAGGYRMPKKIYRMAKRSVARQAARRGVSVKAMGWDLDWIKEGLKSTSCMAPYPRFRSSCEEGSSWVSAVMREANRAQVTCGGQALFVTAVSFSIAGNRDPRVLAGAAVGTGGLCLYNRYK